MRSTEKKRSSATRSSAFEIDPDEFARRTEPIYARIREVNVKFADMEAKKFRISRAEYIDALIDKARKAATP